MSTVEASTPVPISAPQAARAELRGSNPAPRVMGDMRGSQVTLDPQACNNRQLIGSGSSTLTPESGIFLPSRALFMSPLLSSPLLSNQPPEHFASVPMAPRRKVVRVVGSDLPASAS